MPETSKAVDAVLASTAFSMDSAEMTSSSFSFVGWDSGTRNQRLEIHFFCMKYQPVLGYAFPTQPTFAD
ncbi:hypothetical protein [uncultured Rubinisphaera sp.]|uniref:hypothetical protein n=1 Tax=uncultured Rubinisphaera sp. TaxID=1678686 RepID=UPI0030D846E2|tara:strand:- start:4235 stop:4441 length:207 start_codon:yes stop_codon:yes gene_type:complete